MPKLYRITLTTEEREVLLARQRKGSNKSAWYRAASILLLADETAPAGSLTDAAIAKAVHATVRTVERIRERAVCEGIDSIYYMEKGKVVEYYECGWEKYPMRILTPPSTIKMYEFFTGVSSGRTYRSKRYTQMLQLDRKNCLMRFMEKSRQQFFLLR